MGIIELSRPEMVAKNGDFFCVGLNERQSKHVLESHQRARANVKSSAKCKCARMETDQKSYFIFNLSNILIKCANLI